MYDFSYILTNPVFIPAKHPIMTYAQQNRLAKKRRNINKRKSNRKNRK